MRTLAISRDETTGAPLCRNLQRTGVGMGHRASDRSDPGSGSHEQSQRSCACPMAKRSFLLSATSEQELVRLTNHLLESLKPTSAVNAIFL